MSLFGSETDTDHHRDVMLRVSCETKLQTQNYVTIMM